MRKCPKCGYIRQPQDSAPLYACPACGVAYVKAHLDQQEIPGKWLASESRPLGARFRAWARRPIPMFSLILLIVLIILAIDDTWGPGRQMRQERIWRDAAAEARRNNTQQAEHYLRTRLHDPRSFEVVSWSSPVQRDGHTVISLRYRAKNGFGALVVNDATFVLNSSGVVLSMSE